MIENEPCSVVIYTGLGTPPAGPWLVEQPLDTRRDVPGPPFPHGLWRHMELPGHLSVGGAVGAPQHDPRAQRQCLGGRGPTREPHERLTTLVAHHDALQRSSSRHDRIVADPKS